MVNGCSLAWTVYRLDLGREIEVSDSEINHVGEVIGGTESAGTILDHTDDPVDSFGNSVGDSADRSHDSVPMDIDEADEFAQWLNATELRSLAPAFEEFLGAADIDVFPEAGQLVFESAGTINAAL